MSEGQQLPTRSVNQPATAGQLQGAGVAAEVPVQTRLERILNLSASNHDTAQHLLNRLTSLHCRLYGPTPQDPAKEDKAGFGDGMLANLEARQSDITDTLRDAMQVLNGIEEIA